MDHKKITALTLSLLVLPGAGHWYLGRRRAGSLYAAWAMIALLYPLLRYVHTLSAAMRGLASRSPELMGPALSALHNAWQKEYHSLVGGGIALIVCWIVAAGDLMRVRRSTPSDRQPHDHLTHRPHSPSDL